MGRGGPQPAYQVKLGDVQFEEATADVEDPEVSPYQQAVRSVPRRFVNNEFSFNNNVDTNNANDDDADDDGDKIPKEEKELQDKGQVERCTGQINACSGCNINNNARKVQGIEHQDTWCALENTRPSKAMNVNVRYHLRRDVRSVYTVSPRLATFMLSLLTPEDNLNESGNNQYPGGEDVDSETGDEDVDMPDNARTKKNVHHQQISDGNGTIIEAYPLGSYKVENTQLKFTFLNEEEIKSDFSLKNEKNNEHGRNECALKVSPHFQGEGSLVSNVDHHENIDDSERHKYQRDKCESHTHSRPPPRNQDDKDGSCSSGAEGRRDKEPNDLGTSSCDQCSEIDFMEFVECDVDRPAQTTLSRFGKVDTAHLNFMAPADYEYLIPYPNRGVDACSGSLGDGEAEVVDETAIKFREVRDLTVPGLGNGPTSCKRNKSVGLAVDEIRPRVNALNTPGSSGVHGHDDRNKIPASQSVHQVSNLKQPQKTALRNPSKTRESGENDTAVCENKMAKRQVTFETPNKFTASSESDIGTFFLENHTPEEFDLTKCPRGPVSHAVAHKLGLLAINSEYDVRAENILLPLIEHHREIFQNQLFDHSFLDNEWKRRRGIVLPDCDVKHPSDHTFWRDSCESFAELLSANVYASLDKDSTLSMSQASFHSEGLELTSDGYAEFISCSLQVSSADFQNVYSGKGSKLLKVQGASQYSSGISFPCDQTIMDVPKTKVKMNRTHSVEFIHRDGTLDRKSSRLKESPNSVMNGEKHLNACNRDGPNETDITSKSGPKVLQICDCLKIPLEITSHTLNSIPKVTTFSQAIHRGQLSQALVFSSSSSRTKRIFHPISDETVWAYRSPVNSIMNATAEDPNDTTLKNISPLHVSISQHKDIAQGVERLSRRQGSTTEISAANSKCVKFSIPENDELDSDHGISELDNASVMKNDYPDVTKSTSVVDVISASVQCQSASLDSLQAVNETPRRRIIQSVSISDAVVSPHNRGLLGQRANMVRWSVSTPMCHTVESLGNSRGVMSRLVFPQRFNRSRREEYIQTTLRGRDNYENLPCKAKKVCGYDKHRHLQLTTDSGPSEERKSIPKSLNTWQHSPWLSSVRNTISVYSQCASCHDFTSLPPEKSFSDMSRRPESEVLPPKAPLRFSSSCITMVSHSAQIGSKSLQKLNSTEEVTMLSASPQCGFSLMGKEGRIQEDHSGGTATQGNKSRGTISLSETLPDRTDSQQSLAQVLPLDSEVKLFVTNVGTTTERDSSLYPDNKTPAKLPAVAGQGWEMYTLKDLAVVNEFQQTCQNSQKEAVDYLSHESFKVPERAPPGDEILNTKTGGDSVAVADKSEEKLINDAMESRDFQIGSQGKWAVERSVQAHVDSRSLTDHIKTEILHQITQAKGDTLEVFENSEKGINDNDLKSFDIRTPSASLSLPERSVHAHDDSLQLTGPPRGYKDAQSQFVEVKKPEVLFDIVQTSEKKIIDHETKYADVKSLSAPISLSKRSFQEHDDTLEQMEVQPDYKEAQTLQMSSKVYEFSKKSLLSWSLKKSPRSDLYSDHVKFQDKAVSMSRSFKYLSNTAAYNYEGTSSDQSQTLRSISSFSDSHLLTAKIRSYSLLDQTPSIHAHDETDEITRKLSSQEGSDDTVKDVQVFSEDFTLEENDHELEFRLPMRMANSCDNVLQTTAIPPRMEEDSISARLVLPHYHDQWGRVVPLYHGALTTIPHVHDDLGRVVPLLDLTSTGFRADASCLGASALESRDVLVGACTVPEKDQAAAEEALHRLGVSASVVDEKPKQDGPSVDLTVYQTTTSQQQQIETPSPTESGARLRTPSTTTLRKHYQKKVKTLPKIKTPSARGRSLETRAVPLPSKTLRLRSNALPLPDILSSDNASDETAKPETKHRPASTDDVSLPAPTKRPHLLQKLKSDEERAEGATGRSLPQLLGSLVARDDQGNTLHYEASASGQASEISFAVRSTYDDIGVLTSLDEDNLMDEVADTQGHFLQAFDSKHEISPRLSGRRGDRRRRGRDGRETPAQDAGFGDGDIYKSSLETVLEKPIGEAGAGYFGSAYDTLVYTAMMDTEDTLRDGQHLFEEEFTEMESNVLEQSSPGAAQKEDVRADYDRTEPRITEITQPTVAGFDSGYEEVSKSLGKKSKEDHVSIQHGKEIDGRFPWPSDTEITAAGKKPSKKDVKGGRESIPDGGNGKGPHFLLSRKKLSRPTLPAGRVLADGHYYRSQNLISVVVKPVHIEVDRDNLNLMVQVHRQRFKKSHTPVHLPPLRGRESSLFARKPVRWKRNPYAVMPPRPLARNIIELRAANAPFNTALTAEADERYHRMYGRWKVL